MVQYMVCSMSTVWVQYEYSVDKHISPVLNTVEVGSTFCVLSLHSRVYIAEST
jgi:hypothetical protein